MLRGNGVQTYNMKKRNYYGSAVNFTDSDNNWTAAEFNNVNKDNGALMHIGSRKPMTIGPPFTEETVTIRRCYKSYAL
jgi:hypothetical protein